MEETKEDLATAKKDTTSINRRPDTNTGIMQFDLWKKSCKLAKNMKKILIKINLIQMQLYCYETSPIWCMISLDRVLMVSFVWKNNFFSSVTSSIDCAIFTLRFMQIDKNKRLEYFKINVARMWSNVWYHENRSIILLYEKYN